MTLKDRFTTKDLPQLTSWVGFDRMWDELEKIQTRATKMITYPPYNVKKVDENHFVIEMALAGFGPSDIDITTKDDRLVIKGEVKPDDKAQYLYKGIAERAFEHSFTLADSVVVREATMINGMLKLWLEHFVPEEKKSKKIQINAQSSAGTKQFIQD
jgi:molecular chaperone IbpA